MIPLRDTLRSQNYPVVTSSIIVINVLVFFLEMARGQDLDWFLYIYGLVPARYAIPHVAAYFTTGQQLFALFSFMFLHGGFWHLLGNMWSLYIFGDNIEDRLGPLRYLLFYLLCGLTSGLTHLLFNLSSNVPTIGASGAIAGVMGAYFILYPRAKILTLIPIIFIPYFLEIPAFFFLGIWLFFQLLNAAGSNGAGGIAWWAHIGGFIFGIIFLKFLDRMPTTGISAKIRSATVKRNSHRLQVIRPIIRTDDAHLYGTIQISPSEAEAGTQKLVNIPWGFHNRLFRVVVPPGTQAGSKLRLQGLGKQMAAGHDKGDLFLTVVIQS
ncbi:MAG: rhomboid family intramembrane serine protease [Desulfobacterales bacterium]|nr:rhomboid family intramembrane serine protease [Desulfobacterales bacterium]